MNTQTIYPNILVTKRGGRSESFDLQKLRRFIENSVNGLHNQIDLRLVLDNCLSGLYNDIPSKKISELAVLSSKSFIEKDPIYDQATARIFLNSLYKEVFDKKFDFKDFDELYKKTFIKNVKKLVKAGRLSNELLKFDLELLSRNIILENDKLFGYRGLQVLYDRYLITDESLRIRLEAPQYFWMRVAMGLAINEEDKEFWAIKFYKMLSSLRFVSSTPTLFHSGTNHPQLSSCYLTTVEDSLDHIFKSVGDNAQLSKWSGGLGNDWSNVRATGALIRGTNVDSQGVIPFLKIANDTTMAINRSGKRRGATCAYLESWHLDIEDFLDLRRNTGDERRRTHDMNTANWIPDLFMKRVINKETWMLFSPDEVSDLHHLYGKAFEKRYKFYEAQVERGKIRLFKKIEAVELWRMMITRLFETGHPWITFKDPCNIRSPQDHIGVVHSSNLCTEITLNTSKDETAVCNLGSINLAKHIVDGRLDEDLIKETVFTGMRMLDNVIDINFYPTVEAKNSNLRHRPVGMGVMGFVDALFLQDINFDSDQAVEFADLSQEMISYYAISASSEVAREKGAYKSYLGSKWSRGIFPMDTVKILEKERGIKIEKIGKTRMDWKSLKRKVERYGMRNSNCMAIAPTATISNIAGCFPSIEPIYKNLYVKSNMSGEFTVDNHYLIDDLKDLGLWDEEMLKMIKLQDGSIQDIPEIPKLIKDKYKEAFEINPKWLIKQAAARGKWIDQSQSLNIFIKTTSGKVLSDLYLYAWQMGLKTTYYLRTMGASSIEKSSIDLVSQSKGVEKEVLACRLDDPNCEACQ